MKNIDKVGNFRGELQRLQREMMGKTMLFAELAEEYVSFGLLSARLATMGDAFFLDEFVRVVKDSLRLDASVASFGRNVRPNAYTTAIMRRCKQGLWDLAHAEGEDLAIAIVQAQDAKCLRRLTRGLWPYEALKGLIGWSEAAEEKFYGLDGEVLASLLVWTGRFPVQHKHRLTFLQRSTLRDQRLLRLLTP